jgi:peptide-methionine (S)-S-oxide reductase
MSNNDIEIATLANGCFWCTEAIFKMVKGIGKIIPGYSGGITEKPSYHEVCSGTTGHAESIQLEYDPKIISFKKILDIFWLTHDPTTLNRQGNDVGTQYRSAIFYHDEKQKEIAEESKYDIEKAGVYKDAIVTEITPFKNFYPAEDYHKNYYENHKDDPYCNFVINPKLQKLLHHFGNELKVQSK